MKPQVDATRLEKALFAAVRLEPGSSGSASSSTPTDTAVAIVAADLCELANAEHCSQVALPGLLGADAREQLMCEAARAAKARGCQLPLTVGSESSTNLCVQTALSFLSWAVFP